MRDKNQRYSEPGGGGRFSLKKAQALSLHRRRYQTLIIKIFILCLVSSLKEAKYYQDASQAFLHIIRNT